MRKTTREKSTMSKAVRVFSAFLLTAAFLTLASAVSHGQKASDPQFKVKIDFNRWHDVPELYSDMKRLQAAFPKFLKLESVGKSHNGLDIMVMTINNPDTGPEMSKAAMYIEENSTLV